MLILKHAALLFVFLALLVGCGGKPIGAATKPGTAPTSASGTTASNESSSAGTSGREGQQASDTQAFSCTSHLSGGTSAGQLTDVRVAHHPGFDRITFQFEGTSGVPQYKLVPQQSAGFMQDPSGRPLHLDGSAGLGIVFPGTSGMDLSVTPIRRTYNGSQDIKAGLLFVRELAQSGDFERVMSWGVGLSASPCLRVTELSNPARLAIDVRSAPSANSAAEIKAVAQRIFAGAYPMGCSPRDRSVCPVTDRLVARFTELSKPQPDQPGPPNLFCRCQNAASRSMTIDTETTPTGGIAHVTLYPDAFPIKIDLIVVSQGGKLLVDETQCTGRGPSTSIYAAPLTLCGS